MRPDAWIKYENLMQNKMEIDVVSCCVTVLSENLSFFFRFKKFTQIEAKQSFNCLNFLSIFMFPFSFLF